jgi:hypothetical protein
MVPRMKIAALRSENAVSAKIVSSRHPEGFELFFEFSGAAPAADGNWAVVASLLPAMVWREEKLHIDAPVSATLLANLPAIQDIYQAWVPHARRVSVQAAEVIDDRDQRAGLASGSASFFSGGVDSLFTLIKNRGTLTHMILLHGFDVALCEENYFGALRARAEMVAGAFGKRLIAVRTNVREFCFQKYEQWGYYYGAVLAAISLCLSGSHSAVRIGSGYSFNDLVPHGSHPLLDPLWSTGALRIVHDGAESTRMRKVEVIAREPAALRMLRVCREQPESEMNCGQCEKCLRTMVALQLLGRLDQSPTFPHHIDLRQIRRLDLTGVGFGPFWREFLGYPLDPSLRRTIEAVVRAREMGFGGDYGTWKSKARRTLALTRHIGGDFVAGIQVLVGGGTVLRAAAAQTESRSDAK